MTNEDLVDFSRRLVVFGELYDVKFSAARIGLYFEAMRDLPLVDVVRSLNIAARTCKFLPKPAELREFIVGDATEAEERAWLLFRETMQRHGAYASVVTQDAALGDSIRAMFNSWPAACRAELSAEMWASKRKEWSRTYGVMRRRAHTQPTYLPGIVEQENGAVSAWAKHTPVVLIEADSVRALSPSEAAQYRALATTQESQALASSSELAAGALTVVTKHEP